MASALAVPGGMLVGPKGFLKAGDCDATGADVVSSQDFVLHRDQTKSIHVPNGTNVCWRHDRFPTNPKPGEWSGWSRAVLFPSEDTTTDL